MTYFDLGLIDGNSFGAVQVDAIEAAINKGILAAEVRLYVGSAAPTGWLFLNGATVVNFQGLYPDAWAVIPVAWKSGSNANLPNLAGRFPVGQDGSHVLGAAGGSNTHVMSTANLPSHSHAIDHDHGNVTSTGESAHHLHQLDMSASGITVGGGIIVQNTPGPNAVYDVGDTSTGATVFAVGGMQTTIDQNPSTFATADHTHDVNLPNFTGTSGLTGSASAIDHTPAWVAFNFILKVH